MAVDWIRLLSYVSVAGVQLSWLYAVLSFLDGRVAEGSLAVGWIMAFYPLALLVERGLGRFRLGRIRRRILGWLVWLVSCFAFLKVQRFDGLALLDPAWLGSLVHSVARVFQSLSPEFLTIACSGVLWWLGGRLAWMKVDFAKAMAEFQFGLILLVLLSFVTAQMEVPLDHAIPIALCFSLCSLSGIAATHSRESMAGSAGPGRTRWLGLLIVSVTLILAFGLLMISAVTPEVLQVILSILERVGRWIVRCIMEVMAFLARLLPEPTPMPTPMPSVAPVPQQVQSEWVKWLLIPDSVRDAGRFLVSASWLALFLVALWRISSQVVAWVRRRWGELADLEMEPVTGGFGADIRSLLRCVAHWFLRAILRLRCGRGRPLPGQMASVRQIYGRLMRWAARAGIPRHGSQTPNEYLGDLAERFPDARGDLALITGHYVSVRYGPDLPSGHDLQELRLAWWRVRRVKRTRQTAKAVSAQERSTHE